MPDPKFRPTQPKWMQLLQQGAAGFDDNNDGITSASELKTGISTVVSNAWSGLKSTVATLADGSANKFGLNPPDGKTTPLEYITFAAEFLTPGGGAVKSMKSLPIIKNVLRGGSKNILNKGTQNTTRSIGTGVPDYMDIGSKATGNNQAVVSTLKKKGGTSVTQKDISNANFDLGTDNIPYTHGSSSASFPGVVSSKGLKPHNTNNNVTAMSGENTFITNKNHINVTDLSVAPITDPTVAMEYSLMSSGNRNYLKTYNASVDKVTSLNKNASKFEKNIYKNSKKLNYERLKNYSNSSPTDQALMRENYPAIYGIKPKNTKQGSSRYRTEFQSDVSSEVGIKGGVNLDEITDIFVPKNRINSATRKFNNKNIKISSLEDYHKVSNSKVNPYQKAKNAKEFNDLMKTFR